MTRIIILILSFFSLTFWVKAQEIYPLEYKVMKDSISNLLMYAKHKEADSLATKYFEWCVIHKKENEKAYIQSIFLKASTLIGTKEYRKQEELLLKCLELESKYRGKETQYYAEILFQFGSMCFEMQKFEEAINVYMDALSIINKNEDREFYLYPQIYFNLGVIYNHLVDYQKSVAYYSMAIDFYKSHQDFKNPKLADTYNDMGLAYRNAQMYTKALEYYQISLSMYKELYGERHPYVAVSLNNIGAVYRSLEEYEKALQYYDMSLDIRLEIFGEMHALVAQCYNNKSVVYVFLKDFDKALEMNRKSLGIYQKKLGPNHAYVGVAYGNLSNTFMAMEKYDSAIFYSQKSLELKQSVYGDKHFSIGIAHGLLGKLYLKKGAYENALKSVNNQILSGLYSTEDLDYYQLPSLSDIISYQSVIKGLDSKIKILLEVNRYENTLVHIEALDSVLNHYSSTLQTDSDRIFFASNLSTVAYYGVRVCGVLYKKTKDLIYMEKAFYFSQRAKSSVLQASLAEKDALFSAGLTDSLISTVFQYNKEINICLEKLSTLTNTKEKEEWHQLLFSKREQYDSLMKYIENEYPLYASLSKESGYVSLSDFQKRLKKNQAMLLFQVFDSVLISHCITKKEYTVRFGDTYELQKNIAAFRNGINHHISEIVEKSASELHSLVYPKELKKSIKSLLIVPDGILSLLPFEALVINAKERWLDRFEICYSYSPTLWCNSLDKVIYSHENSSILAIAPVFAQSEKVEGTFQRTLEEEKDTSLERNLQTMNHKYVSTLPATVDEVEAIASLFKNREYATKVLLKEDASENSIHAIDFSNIDYIHFATHGFVNTSKPELSGIMLTYDSTSKEDGFLLMGEIMNLKLNARLVTLSACETGLGKQSTGEGLLGLSRAFIYAGAKNLLVSLWKVSDESTSRLMVLFYEEMLNHKNSSLTYAIRMAKKRLISEGKYKDPYYWSPFILIGN